MKLSGPVAVFAAAALLAGAAVAVSSATTTTPLTLCSNNKTGAVSVPSSSGTCPKGTTGVQVAAPDDLQRLAERVDAAEADIAAVNDQAGAIADLEGLLAGEITVTTDPATNPDPYIQEVSVITIRARFLQPGAQIVLHRNDASGNPVTDFLSTAVGGAYYNRFSINQASCTLFSPAWVTSIGAEGDVVTSNIVQTPVGC